MATALNPILGGPVITPAIQPVTQVPRIPSSPPAGSNISQAVWDQLGPGARIAILQKRVEVTSAGIKVDLGGGEMKIVPSTAAIAQAASKARVVAATSKQVSATIVKANTPPSGSGVSQAVWDGLGKGTKQAIVDGRIGLVIPDKVTPEVWAQLGPGVKEKGTVEPKLSIWQKLYGTEAPLGTKAAWKSAAIWGTESVIPYVYTVREWNKLSPTQKGLNLALDTLIIAPFLAKGIMTVSRFSQVIKADKEARAVMQVANQTGQARAGLRRAIVALDNAEKAGLVPKKAPIPANSIHRALLDNLERAAQKSAKLDQKFADQFQSLSRLRAGDLAKFEKRSGFQGLKASVDAIGKTETDITAKWKAFRQLPEEAIEHSLARQGILRDLQGEYDIEKGKWLSKGLYDKLDQAYVDYAKTLNVKGRLGIDPADLLKPPLQLPEMPKDMVKELMAKFEKAYGATPPGGGMSAETRARLAEVIRKESGTSEERFWEMTPETRAEIARAKTRVATATKEAVKPETKVAESLGAEKEQEVKELLEKEVKPKLAPAEEIARGKAPKVATEEGKPKFGLSPREKFVPAPRSIPQEVLGRQTWANIAREYGEQAVEDAIGKPIYDIKSKGDTKTAQEVNRQFERQLSRSVSTAVDRFTKAYNETGNLTDAKNAAKQETRPQSKPQTKVQTAVRTAVKTATDEIIDRMKPPREKLAKGTGGQNETPQVENVEGVPKNAGTVVLPQGLIDWHISPPYRKGIRDIKPVKRAQPSKGRGAPQLGVHVLNGEAPVKLTLRLSKKSAVDIFKGRKLHYYAPQRGPGLIGRDGVMRRAARPGSLLQ